MPARKPDLTDLMGLAEVAAATQVSKRTALDYTRREDFPAPLARLAAGPVWSGQDVRRWAGATLPLQGGRPRKLP
jgi:predicted DNA-binding transcriptional regulator AlpA